MTHNPTYDAAIAAIQYAKENGLHFYAFIGNAADQFGVMGVCSERDMRGYINHLLNCKPFPKVALKEAAKHFFDKIAAIPTMPDRHGNCRWQVIENTGHGYIVRGTFKTEEEAQDYIDRLAYDNGCI